MGCTFNYEQKLTAAYQRHREGRSWVRCAEAIGAEESTLRKWDRYRDEEWERACAEVIDEMRREGAGAAWRALVEQVKQKCDVAAAKEILNRTEGAVPNKHQVGGDPDGVPIEHQFAHLTVDQLAAVARNGDGNPTGDDSAEGTGAEGSDGGED